MTAVATAPVSAAGSKRSFSEVWVISTGHALTHWYPATFYMLLPLIGSELGLSFGQVGLIVSAMYFAGAISNIPGGMIADSVGRKGLLMALSLFWVGFPYMLMSVSHYYWMLLACAVLIGIGNNLWHPTAIPTLAQRFADRKGLVVSIHGMGGNVGDALAPFVAGLLLHILTWRQVLLVNVIPGVLMSMLILAFVGRVNFSGSATSAGARSVGRMLGDYGKLLANRTLVLLAVSSAFRTMTQTSLLAFLPLYLTKSMGYTTTTAGAAMMGLQLAGFLAAPIAGHMSDGVGRRNIMVTSMLMSGLVLALMIFAGQSPLFVGLVAILGFFLFAVRAVLQAWTLDATPKGMGGSSIAMLFGIQAIGAGIGPYVCGLIADQYGLMATFYFMAATIVIANLFVFAIPAQNKSVAA